MNDLPRLNAAIEPLFAAAAGNPRALLQLAEGARSCGNLDRAVEIAIEAWALAGRDSELAAWAADIISQTIPGFHVAMIRDQSRNQAFEDALARAVTPETRLLDVGSGTGLLAMMAARAGATQVYSCEANVAMADVAIEIVQINGFDDRISILPKHSTALNVDADLGGPVDLVIAEVVGLDLVNEGVLPSMRDVARRLVKPGARVIPQSGDIRVALAWCDTLGEKGMAMECGFDMTPFNRLLPSRFVFKVGKRELHLRGEEASLFSFDFAATTEQADRTELDLIAHGGSVNGIVQWIRLQMDEEGFYENHPAPGARSHWDCQFFPLARAIEAAPGAIVRIGATHRGNRLRLWEV